MTSAMVAEPRCAACGEAATHIELVPPGQLPAQWQVWDKKRQESLWIYRYPAQ
jgi:hypothetical protein